jgi:ribosomal protein L37AE/L43A
VTHQPAISFSISIHFPFNRAGGRTSNVRQKYEDKMTAIRSQFFDPCCPVCGQGGLQPIHIKVIFPLPYWICSECDALWEGADFPTASCNFRFYDYMAQRGFPDDWQLVSDRDLVDSRSHSQTIQAEQDVHGNTH